MNKNKLKYTSDIAFTPTVKAMQEKYNSRKNYARMEQSRGWQSEVTPQLEYMLHEADSFYMGTANASGQPYIQHRGGPKGFLKVLDKKRLAFADFSGNMQYITVGTLEENNKAFIFLMDYPNQSRIKIWGTAEVVFDDDKLLNSLIDSTYHSKPERVIIFTIDAWDMNCPQHITRRFTLDTINAELEQLKNRIKELEAENASLKNA